MLLFRSLCMSAIRGGWMAKTTSVASREVSDALWERMELLILAAARGDRIGYTCTNLEVGVSPRIHGWCSKRLSTCYAQAARGRRSLEWQVSGVFEALWEGWSGRIRRHGGHCLALTKHRRLHDEGTPGTTDCRLQLDGSGKNGSKRHLLVDGRGVPLSLIVTGPAGMTSASCQQCWRPSWSNVRTYRSDVTNTRVPMPVTLVLPHS